MAKHEAAAAVMLEKTAADVELASLRTEIDGIDAELVQLLARRFDCVRRIGAVKAQAGLPVVAAARFEVVIGKAQSAAAAAGVNPALVRRIYELIHEEACAEQRRLARAG